MEAVSNVKKISSGLFFVKYLLSGVNQFVIRNS